MKPTKIYFIYAASIDKEGNSYDSVIKVLYDRELAEAYCNVRNSLVSYEWNSNEDLPFYWVVEQEIESDFYMEHVINGLVKRLSDYETAESFSSHFCISSDDRNSCES